MVRTLSNSENKMNLIIPCAKVCYTRTTQLQHKHKMNMKEARRESTASYYGMFLTDLDKYVPKWKKALIAILSVSTVISALGLISVQT